MVFITSIISSDEWVKLRDAAAAQFPGEALARARFYVVMRWRELRRRSVWRKRI
jgi:hypothetical protein